MSCEKCGKSIRGGATGLSPNVANMCPHCYSKVCAFKGCTDTGILISCPGVPYGYINGNGEKYIGYSNGHFCGMTGMRCKDKYKETPEFQEAKANNFKKILFTNSILCNKKDNTYVFTAMNNLSLEYARSQSELTHLRVVINCTEKHFPKIRTCLDNFEELNNISLDVEITWNRENSDYEIWITETVKQTNLEEFIAYLCEKNILTEKSRDDIKECMFTQRSVLPQIILVK